MTSTVRMSHALGLRIVTEGVETHEVLRTVREGAGCDAVQGFFTPAPRREQVTLALQAGAVESTRRSTRGVPG